MKLSSDNYSYDVIEHHGFLVMTCHDAKTSKTKIFKQRCGTKDGLMNYLNSLTDTQWADHFKTVK